MKEPYCRDPETPGGRAHDRLPESVQLRREFQAIKRYLGPTGAVRLDAERSDKAGHADWFWASALLCAAAEGRSRDPVDGGLRRDGREDRAGRIDGEDVLKKQPGVRKQKGAPTPLFWQYIKTDVEKPGDVRFVDAAGDKLLFAVRCLVELTWQL